MKTPENYKVLNTHEWVKFEGNKALIGISDYAQDAMGDIVFINLPEVGTNVSIGEAFTDVESVKAVSEVNSPVDGKITRINEELEDTPELINADPYNTWIIEVEYTKIGDLMTAEEYDAMDKE